MIKSSFILFLILLNYTNALPGDEDDDHEALMRLKNIRSSILKSYPFQKILSDDSDESNESVIEKYMCPAEDDEDVANMEEASKVNYTLRYCLFKKIFQKNEDKTCQREVKPIFNILIDKQLQKTPCGFAQRQFVYVFGYFDCGDEKVLEKFRDENIQKNPFSYKFNRISRHPYEICYDTVGKLAVWTRHFIQSPELFQNPYFQNQQPLPETEISTDSYFMDADTFFKLEKQYELEKQKNPLEPGTFIMVPQPLVPAEHFALSMSKKTTNHYLNRAPLWENLVPLMNAIDQGIKQAQMKLESENPEKYYDLKIHTRVAPHQKLGSISKSRLSLLLFRGNIWCKFIRHMKDMTAVLIIVYNTPGNPPSQEEGCTVGKRRKCDFKKWSKDKQIQERITSDTEKYAFCCKVSPADIGVIFSLIYEIKDYLDIESLIT